MRRDVAEQAVREFTGGRIAALDEFATDLDRRNSSVLETPELREIAAKLKAAKV